MGVYLGSSTYTIHQMLKTWTTQQKVQNVHGRSAQCSNPLNSPSNCSKQDSPQNCSKPRPCFKVLSKRRRQCVKLFKTKTVRQTVQNQDSGECIKLFKTKTVHQTVQKQDSPSNCSQPRQSSKALSKLCHSQPIKRFRKETTRQTAVGPLPVPTHESSEN